MTPKEAARWLRRTPEEKEERVAATFTAPSWTQVKTEIARRDNEAMEIVLTFVEEA